MKLTALILTTVILFLALKPGLTLVSECGKESICCVESCEPFDTKNESDVPNGACDGNGCNPFQSCSSSLLFDLISELMKIERPLIGFEANFTYHSYHQAQWISDFWQPPQNA